LIKAVIIDDEPVHHDVMKRNLNSFCPEVKVVAQLYSGEECIKQLPRLNVDILFMDIQLGDMNSFELLQKLPNSDYHIIFITSYDQYALQAFKVHAIDFLLKPVDGRELVYAIDRAMSQIISREKRQGLFADYAFHKNNKLIVSDTYEYRFIGIEKIMYCKADGNYTDIFYKDDSGIEQKFKDSHNLKYYEDKLLAFGFIRIHQSFLVNKEQVVKIKKKSFEVVMHNNITLPIARERRQLVMDWFSDLFN
jgi:two-component system LytT family response regulator